MDLAIKSGNPEAYEPFVNIIQKLANIDQLTYTDEKVSGTLGFVIKSDEFFIPMEEGAIDIEAEKAEIIKEIEYTKGFLNSVMKKLSNERFVAGAPEQVVAIEKAKQADAEGKIKVLEEKLAGLS